MAVKVLKDGQTIKFYPESSADSDLAHYLSGLVNEARNLAKSADETTVSKAGLTGIALIRKEQEQRVQVLKDVADREDAKSRDWSMSGEMRQLANQRAFAAREEMRRLSAELGQ